MSINKAFDLGDLITFQKQVILKIIGKWIKIKIFQRLEASFLTQNLFHMICTFILNIFDQMADVNGRFVSERGRLKPAVLEISNSLKMLGLLLKIYI